MATDTTLTDVVYQDLTGKPVQVRVCPTHLRTIKRLYKIDWERVTRGHAWDCQKCAKHPVSPEVAEYQRKKAGITHMLHDLESKLDY